MHNERGLHIDVAFGEKMQAWAAPAFVKSPNVDNMERDKQQRRKKATEEFEATLGVIITPNYVHLIVLFEL